jgi:hypothetical protein
MSAPVNQQQKSRRRREGYGILTVGLVRVIWTAPAERSGDGALATSCDGNSRFGDARSTQVNPKRCRRCALPPEKTVGETPTEATETVALPF